MSADAIERHRDTLQRLADCGHTELADDAAALLEEVSEG